MEVDKAYERQSDEGSFNILQTGCHVGPSVVNLSEWSKICILTSCWKP